MAAENYDAALKQELVLEGGNVDDPRDAGGRTSRGVTQRVYDADRRRRGLPTQDVWKATDDEIAAIYKTQYWDVILGDQLPAGLDLLIFDGSINSGPVQSVKWAQRSLGNVRVDGHLGKETLDAIIAYPDHDLLIASICDRRMAFLKALKTWRTYKNGWTSRVDHIKQASQAMATGSVGPDPSYFTNGEKKAFISDARKPPSLAPASAVGTGGVVTMTIQQVTGSLQPLQGWIPIIDHTVGAITAAGGILTAGGLAYAAWAKHRANTINDALNLGETPAPPTAVAPVAPLPPAPPATPVAPAGGAA
jgi:lysozyme family protein